MKTLLLYVLPLAIVFALAAMLPADAGVTPSSVTSLRSPTPVLNGPILSGRLLNIGEAVTTVPYTGSGLQRPVGSLAYDRAGAVAYLKTGSTATGWEAIGSGALTGGATRVGGLNVRAAQLAGLSSTLMTCTHDDFVNTPTTPLYLMIAAGGGNAAVSPTTTTVGGMSDVNTSASAGSLEIVANPALVIPRLDTGQWYAAARFAVTTATDAQAKAGFMLGDGGYAPRIGVGFCGNNSVTNYSVFQDAAGAVCGGTLTTTTVSFAIGGQHVFELYSNGQLNKFHVLIDGVETPGSPYTQAAPPVISQRAAIAVQNGTTAANRTLEIDWWHLCWNET